ncbi:MAG: DUF1848 domain-containing protein [Calditrichia bacterium]
MSVSNEKVVISASRRTDLPAFYLPWLVERVREGFVEVRNPFNAKQVRRVSLSPAEVGWMVLWSRNYRAFLREREWFEDYHLFFHFTINPPHHLLEPGMVDPATAWQQMEQLAGFYGPERITWRYDPIVHYRKNGVVETNHSLPYFKQSVRKASALGLKRCYISIAHIYSKMRKRAANFGENFRFVEPSTEEADRILREMVEAASLFGVQVYSCSNLALTRIPGIRPASCIDGALLNKLGSVRVSEKKNPTRKDCGCTVSVDIGDYRAQQCRYRCLYCYARP